MMNLHTPSSPHFHANNSISQVMFTVIAALSPGIAVYIYFFGSGLLIQMLLGILTAITCETLILLARKKPVWPFISDGSAVLTAILLALSIPPSSPWWIIVLGTSFAIVFVKHLYGGLGYNIFNPAMAGYAMLIISFPKEITGWFNIQANSTSLSLSEYLGLIFTESKSSDTISQATPLDHFKTQIGLEQPASTIFTDTNLYSGLGAYGFEWIGLAFALGGVWLVYKKIMSWHIPLSLLISLVLISLVFYAWDNNNYASPLFHLFSGATLLGAFFIATDPVSACSTLRGKIIYGSCIGVLIFIIRNWGGYPDAIAFAVLIMNMCAPTIDYYTRPGAQTP